MSGKIEEEPAIGTKYSCVGVWKDNRDEIIPNELGGRTTPCYVAFTNSVRLIGHDATDQAAMNPINTLFGELLASHSEVTDFRIVIKRSDFMLQ